MSKITPANVAVLSNMADPDSVALTDYYRVKRGIPDDNIIGVRLPASRQITLSVFNAFKATVDAALAGRPDIEVIAMAWGNPSRINCNAITWALSAGYTPDNICSSAIPGAPYDGNTLWSPYYERQPSVWSKGPIVTPPFRRSMMLGARTLADSKAVIDRAVAADGTFPFGRALIMNTSDRLRNIRAGSYLSEKHPIGKVLTPYIDIQIMNASYIHDVDDVLFYFNGIDQYKYDPAWNIKFPPGAYADMLTSFGGMLDNGRNIWNYLAVGGGGASATSGTVSEPYALTTKFVDPWPFLNHYVARGETFIEAWWASVEVPFQNLPIGDPLMCPWGNAVIVTPVSIAAPTFLPSTIGKHSSINVRSVITFNQAVLKAVINYTIFDAAGFKIRSTHENAVSIPKGGTYTLKVNAIVRPTVPGPLTLKVSVGNVDRTDPISKAVF